MPAVIVKLNGVGNAVWIEGAGGTVTVVDANLELQGQFVFRIGGKTSQAVEFGNGHTRALVVADGSAYRLVECPALWFRWQARQRLAQQGVASSPWLAFSAVSLQQVKGSVSLISLSDFSCSLVADSAEPGLRQLAYPSQAGVSTTKLIPLAHPSDPQRRGAFLYLVDGRTGVKLGSVEQQTNIDHAVALELGFAPWSCEFWFMFSAQDPSSVTFRVVSTGKSGVIAISGAAGDTGNLAMADHPGAQTWEELLLEIDELVSDGATLRVQPGAFKSSRLWLGHTAITSPEVENVTGMLTPTSRLGLSLELPSRANLTNRLPVMRLSYHDTTLATGAKASQTERHYGIRVAGLGTRAGGLAILDADEAVFELSGNSTTPMFHLKAGGPGEGLLVPKRDAKDTRRLSVPVGDLALELTSPVVPSTSVLRIDTSVPELAMVQPMMVAPPAGITSGTEARLVADDEYGQWKMKMKGKRELVFGLNNGKLTAPANWADDFVTADPSTVYPLIDHPGAMMTIDPPPSKHLRASGSVSSETKFTRKVDPADNKEKLVYTAFFAAVSYVLVRGAMEGNFGFLDQSRLKIELVELDKDFNSDYVKSATAAGLQVVYRGTSPGAIGGLRSFITTNLEEADNQNPEFFVWPFVMGLGILLRERKPSTGGIRFSDEIALQRKPGCTPCIAYDLSGEKTLNPKDLGWNDWAEPANPQPLLWPRYDKRTGARLDPTVEKWRGIILRDLPLVFPLTKTMQDKASWIGKFVRKTNEHMMLDYAYQDEKGVTWKGGATGLGPDGIFIGMDNWKGTFEIYLEDVQVLGAAGSVVNAEATVRFLLPRIKQKSNKDKPLELSGTFGLDLSGDAALARVDVKQDGKLIATDDVPGFETITLRRILASADTAQIELALVAGKALAEALPFLSGDKPQDAFIVFNLKGDPSGVFELALPAEVNTNLFGRWPVVVQSMRLTFEPKAVEFRITGRVTLGMGPFSSVGVAVVLRRENGDVSFNVELQQLDIALSLGQCKLSGALSWGKPEESKTPPLLKEIAKHRDRDMWGTFTFDDGGFFGQQTIAMRAGNIGAISYWVACIVSKTKKPINLGIGKLENASLLLAHNADLSGGLRDIALDPSGAIFAKLRPEPGEEVKWLTGWKPSASVGTALAASGFFTLDGTIVKSPVAPDEDVTDKNKGLLSGVLFIDTGVLRVDGVAKLFTDKPAHFGMAVDFDKGKFLASFQTDPIKFGTFEFQPGRLAIGFGFKGSTYLDVRLGWPERIGGTEYERDWNQALSFHDESAPLPINSGWGGIRMSLDADKIVVGVAFRCGWSSKEGDAQGGSGGGYSVGYAIGGVVQFQYSFNAFASTFRPLVAQEAPRGTNALSPNELQALTAFDACAAAAFDAMIMGDLAMKGELFGDVWGSAWLRFMGVTIAAIDLKAFARFQICGSLNDGMTSCRAMCGFSASVTILCVTYSTSARYEIVVRDNGCAIESILSHEQLLQIANARPAAIPQQPSLIEAIA